MRERLRVGDVVDRDEVEIASRREARSEDVSADPSKAVDADANAHDSASIPRPFRSVKALRRVACAVEDGGSF
jgi:hypothetical protein